jgi:hypothetical protein
MKFEQVDLNFDQDGKSEGPKVIPYSETLPKEGESSEEYTLRSLDLAKKIVTEEIVIAEATPEELNAELKLLKKLETPIKNEIKKTDKSPKVIYDSSTQAKIDQMKSRKDLDY